MPNVFDEIHSEAQAPGNIFAQIHSEAQAADKKPDQAQHSWTDSMKDAASTAWERAGGKAAVDLLGGASRDPEKARKAAETLHGLLNGVADMPKQVWDALGRTGQEMVNNPFRIDRLAYELAGAVPMVGQPAQQIAQDIGAGNYAKAVGGTAALVGPFVAPELIGKAREVAPVVGKAIGDAASATWKKAGSVADKAADMLPAGIEPLDLGMVGALYATGNPHLAAGYAGTVGLKALAARKAANLAKAAAAVQDVAPPVAPAAAPLEVAPAAAALPPAAEAPPSTFGRIGKVTPVSEQPVVPPASTGGTLGTISRQQPAAPVSEAPPVAAAPPPRFQADPRANGASGLTGPVADEMALALAFKRANPQLSLNSPEFRAFKAARQAAPAPVPTAVEPATSESSLPATVTAPAPLPASALPAPAPVEPLAAPEAQAVGQEPGVRSQEPGAQAAPTLEDQLRASLADPAAHPPPVAAELRGGPNEFAARARELKTRKMVDLLERWNIDGASAAQMTDTQWSDLEKAAGVKSGSAETRKLVLDSLGASSASTASTESAALPETAASAAEAPKAPVPPSDTSASDIHNLPVGDIAVDPARFQFKRDTGGKAGVGDELKDVQKYDPELAGVTSVWKDPADGKTYIVNGHHRLDLASRSGEPTVRAQYLQAKTAQEARAKGALINIAEGRGTPLDAAKLFRDSEMTPAEIHAKGISLKGDVARQGIALSNLSEPIFERTVNGDLPVKRAAMIGETLADHADQKAFVELLDRTEAKGKKLPDDQLRELIRFTKDAPKTTETNYTLFGEEQMTHNHAIEMSGLSSYIKQRMGQEKRLFTSVGSNAAAARLGAHGNVINAETNAGIAQQSAQAMEVYDKLSTSSGPIHNAIVEGAKKIAEGGSEAATKEAVYESVRQAISRTLGVGKRVGAERPGADLGVAGDRLQAGEAQGESASVPPPVDEPGTLGSIGKKKVSAKRRETQRGSISYKRDDRTVNMFGDEPAPQAAAATRGKALPIQSSMFSAGEEQQSRLDSLHDKTRLQKKQADAMFNSPLEGPGGTPGGLFDDQQGMFGGPAATLGSIGKKRRK